MDASRRQHQGRRVARDDRTLAAAISCVVSGVGAAFRARRQFTGPPGHGRRAERLGPGADAHGLPRPVCRSPPSSGLGPPSRRDGPARTRAAAVRIGRRSGDRRDGGVPAPHEPADRGVGGTRTRPGTEGPSAAARPDRDRQGPGVEARVDPGHGLRLPRRPGWLPRPGRARSIARRPTTERSSRASPSSVPVPPVGSRTERTERRRSGERRGPAGPIHRRRRPRNPRRPRSCREAHGATCRPASRSSRRPPRAEARPARGPAGCKRPRAGARTRPRRPSGPAPRGSGRTPRRAPRPGRPPRSRRRERSGRAERSGEGEPGAARPTARPGLPRAIAPETHDRRDRRTRRPFAGRPRPDRSSGPERARGGSPPPRATARLPDVGHAVSKPQRRPGSNGPRPPSTTPVPAEGATTTSPRLRHSTPAATVLSARAYPRQASRGRGSGAPQPDRMGAPIPGQPVAEERARALGTRAAARGPRRDVEPWAPGRLGG